MSKTTITIIKDGPAVINTEGELIEVIHENKSISLVSKTALCMCGKSRNKPFCDGSHKELPTIINNAPFQ